MLRRRAALTVPGGRSFRFGLNRDLEPAVRGGPPVAPQPALTLGDASVVGGGSPDCRVWG